MQEEKSGEGQEGGRGGHGPKGAKRKGPFEGENAQEGKALSNSP